MGRSEDSTNNAKEFVDSERIRGHRGSNSATMKFFEGTTGRIRSQKRTPGKWTGWWLVVYVYVLGTFSIGLSQETNLWWLVLVFGLASLVAFIALNRPSGREREDELMAAIQSQGDLTPAEAALQTSLTIEEAKKMLEKLALKNHLQSRTEGEAIVYGLHKRTRFESSPRETGTGDSRLEEPLSTRELEVLGLLSRGRTNSEISAELFISVGTVKTHVNNIYRKLEVRNRTEAVSKARELNLLS